MAVTRGQRMVRADIDALSTLANSRTTLEGKPYVFLPRAHLIDDKGQGQQPSSTDHNRWNWNIYGFDVGDVAINPIAPNRHYRLLALPATDAANWVLDITWKYARDTTARDALGAVADGTKVYIALGPVSQGPTIEIRRAGAWHFALGWASEFNRLRYAMGRRLNAIDPARSAVFVPTERAVISQPYLYPFIGNTSFQTSGRIISPDQNGMQALGTQWKDVEFWIPDGQAGATWKRTITPALSAVTVGGQVQTGFTSNATPGGNLIGSLGSSGFNVFTTGSPPVPVDARTAGVVTVQLSGPLAAKVLTAQILPTGAANYYFKVTFDGTEVGPQNWWLTVTMTLAAGYQFNPAIDGRFYRNRVKGEDLVIERNYGPLAGAAAAAVHSSQTFQKISFVGENTNTTRLPGAVSDALNIMADGENSGAVSYGPTPGIQSYVSAVGLPIASSSPNGDGTAFDHGFAPHQFDIVSSPEMFGPVVSTESRGPYLSQFQNLPRPCLCKVYPTVYDPYPIANYVVFRALDQVGQIVRVVAIRQGTENDQGVVIPEADATAVAIEVGCYRNGAFVKLLQVDIGTGAITGVWTGILPVFEFVPLVVKCPEVVAVYPLWFSAERGIQGLGDGTLAESANLPLLSAVSPLMTADHYNETTALLNLIP